jgi:exopolyphosphatase/guanosine-5'-triphosphate,3'-diphosphate pyrophosphatase
MPRYAAIDIGSNSMRMEAAEVIAGQAPRVLASDREVTRLGESVFRAGAASEEAIGSTCAVLARMAVAYRKLDVVGVRAVATSAVRDMRNQRVFLARASEAAGTPVEIISGREEARLIHLGVESTWPQAERRSLVLDIGGGSVELIAAEGARLHEAFSRPLGAVRLREMFLGEDPAPPRQLHMMRVFIREKFEPALARLENQRWDRAIVTSATASTVASAVARVPRSQRDAIDRLRVSTAQVRRLYNRLAELSLAGRRRVTGIGPRRAEIIVPGVAVLLEFLEAFKLAAFYYSRSGVRDGIIADLAQRQVGAELSRLSREQRREVTSLGRRYGVPLDHARAAASMSALLFDALQPLHALPPACGKLLEAAAYLHDVGHFVSGTAHHKHSHYVVAHSDLAGFTDRERLLIAALCRYHRKSLPSPEHAVVQALSPEERRMLLLMVPVLRLADSLAPGGERRVGEVECRLQDGGVVLRIGGNSGADLEEWGVVRAGDAFRQIYNLPLSVVEVHE